MTSPNQVSFDRYLDIIFATATWLDACVGMLSAFLEDVESCRDNLDQRLPSTAPSIVDQVVAIAAQARRLEGRFRDAAEQRGPEFQTAELGAILWWAGMASHKAAGAAESARRTLAQCTWEDAFFEIHALMYDTMTALSLLSAAEGMMQRMETDSAGRERPN